MIIAGKDCEDCIYSSIDDSNKARIKVYCSHDDKTRWYGQCVPCDNRRTEKIKGDSKNE